MSAQSTHCLTHQLALEMVKHYAVFPSLVIVPESIALLFLSFTVVIQFFVFRFVLYSIQMQTHAVKQKTKELLRVLLSIPTELRCN
jgi:hypothetical protein